MLDALLVSLREVVGKTSSGEQVDEQVGEPVGQQVGQQVDEQDLCFSKCIVCGPAPVSAVIPDLFLLSS
jgi:hypothetical protein